MANPVVGIDLELRLEQFKADMATLPGIASKEGKAMAAQLAKELRAVEKATKDAAKASKEATNAASGFGDAASKAGGSAQKLGGALGMISPAAQGAAGSLADLADVGEMAAEAGAALGISSGIVGVALLAVAEVAGVAYLAYRVFNEESDRLKVTAKDVAAAHAAQLPLLQALAASTTALSVATGELSAEQAALEAVSDRALKALSTSTDGTTKSVHALRVEQEGFQGSMLGLADSVIPAWTPLGVLFDGLTTSAEEMTPAIDALNSTLADSRRITADTVANDKQALIVTRKKAETEKAAADAKAAAEKAAAAGAKRRAEAEADAERAAAETLKATTDYEATLNSLAKTADNAADARLSGEARIRDALKEAQAEVDAQAKAEILANKDNAERIINIRAAQFDAIVQLERTAEAEIAALKQAAMFEDDAREDAAFLAYKERLAEEVRLQEAKDQATASATGDLLGATSDAFAAAADAQGKTNKRAALALFAASKATAIAQGIVNTALSISSALTLPPPASFIAAAAAGVSGAVAVGAIVAAAPPAFNDTPGVQRMAQRGDVSLASGDFFAAARSPAELQRQIGGTSGGGVQILQVRLGHRVLDQSVARTIQEGGRLSRELAVRTKTGVTGHRAR